MFCFRRSFVFASLIAVTAATSSASGQEPAAESTAAGDSTGAAGEADAENVPDEAALKEARLHFGNGVDLLKENPPNYQDAYRQFALAYEKSGNNWKILGNLGLCALKLERDGEALQFYSTYLEEGGEEIEESERKSIEKEVLLLKGNMATVKLSSPESGVRVSVARKGSTVPAQLYEVEGETEIGLRAGQLTITASTGDNEESWEVVLSASEHKSHEFTFKEPEPEAVAAPAAATAASPAEEEKKGLSSLQVVGLATGGVGVGALVGGVITGVMSSSKESEARDQCIDNVCPESAEEDFQSAEDLALITNVLLISGGVLTATGVTLFVVGAGGGKESDPSTALVTRRKGIADLAISPAALSGGAGLTAVGHF